MYRHIAATDVKRTFAKFSIDAIGVNEAKSDGTKREKLTHSNVLKLPLPYSSIYGNRIL